MLQISHSDRLFSFKMWSQNVSDDFSPFLNVQKNKYSKTCLQRPLSKRPKLVFKIDFPLMQVIKLPFAIKIFVLSNFEWTLKIGFTVDC